MIAHGKSIVRNVLLLAVGCLLTQPADGHELKVVPLSRSDGKLAIIPALVGSQHTIQSPAPIDFGKVAAYDVVTIPVSLTNTTTHLLSASLTTTAGDVQVVPASLSLGPAGSAYSSAEVQVTYSPTAPGTLSEKLRIASTHTEPGTVGASAYTETVPILGSAEAEPAHTESTPNPLAFGPVQVGTNGVNLVVVANTSSHPLTVTVSSSVAALTVLPPATFALSANGSVGSSATVSVKFAPAQLGSVSATLDISSTHGPHTLTEAIGVVGSGATAANLVLRDRVTHVPVTNVNLGTMTAGTDFISVNNFEFANLGGVPVTDVSVTNLNPVLIGGDQNCSVTEARGFCIAAGPLNALVPSLIGLPAGAVLPVSFQFRGDAPGDLDWPYSIQYNTQSLSLRAQGRVVPYLPTASQQAGAVTTQTLGAATGPGGGDYTINVMGPRLARGYGIDKLFHDVDNIDSVNLLNGNLAATIPIGPPIKVSERLVYNVQLTYNSNVWDQWKRVYEGSPYEAFLAAPAAAATAGQGWSLHFGRLCLPTDWNQFPLSEVLKQRSVCRGNYFEYVGPDGSRHEFDGQTPNTPLTYLEDRARQFKRDNLYARDGSYLRLHRIDNFSYELQFPDGNVHVFEYKTSWNDDWDDWRLTAMRDGYGNSVLVSYAHNSASLTISLSHCLSPGCAGADIRYTIVALTKSSTSFFRYRVSSVTLAGYGNAARTYTLHYDEATVRRPYAGTFDPGGSFTVPLLRSVDAPGQTAAYEMDYFENLPDFWLNSMLSEVQLPTRGRIQYEYTEVQTPLGEPCFYNTGGGENGLTKGVSHRKLVDRSGDEVFKESFYRYELRLGAGIPTIDYCKGSPTASPPQAATPAGARVTAVVVPIQRDSAGNALRHKVTVNHFSVFPITYGGQLMGQDALPPAGGWTGAEFGLPFTRNSSYQAGDDTAYLSTEIYESGALPASWTITTLLGSRSPLRQTYVNYQLEPRHCDAGEACPPANARETTVIELFGDDAGQWRKTVKKNSDGLGHFRRVETSSNENWSSDLKTAWTNWNPAAGTLNASFAAVTHEIAVPGKWFLGIAADQYVQVGASGSTRRAADQCWVRKVDASKNIDVVRLTRHRKRAAAGLGANDLITKYSVADNGQLLQEEVFGGDGQTVPTGAGWCADNLGTAAYTKFYTYDINTRAGGRRVETRTVRLDGGPNMTDVDLDIWSGLPAASRDGAGRETTFGYDSRDRLIDQVFPIDATLHLIHSVGAANRIEVVGHPRGHPETHLAEGEVTFDDIGRVLVEREKLADGTWNRSTIRYDALGLTGRVTTVQADASFDSTENTSYLYDVLGRPISSTAPDGSSVTMSYVGERSSSYTASVGTSFSGQIGTSGTVNEEDVTYKRWLDPFGNVTSLVTPLYTTTFAYDSGGNLVSSTRGVQTRTRKIDGRGFLTEETTPEGGTVTYGGYDPLGNPGSRSDGAGSLVYEFDDVGRVKNVREASESNRLLKEFTYHDSGNGKGQPGHAYRYNYLTAADTGGVTGLDGKWTVREDYEYGIDGRLSKRTTTVLQPDDSTPASWDQTWSYDATGQLGKLGYPVCRTTSSACNGTRRLATYAYSNSFVTGVAGGNSLGATGTYHPNGSIFTITHDDATVDTYGNAANGLPRISSIDLAGWSLGGFSYDGSSNLIGIGSHRYVYDKTGRLSEHREDGKLKDWYSYTTQDALASVNGTSLSVANATSRLSGEQYDEAGRQRTRGTCVTMAWDGFGMMRSYRDSGACGEPEGGHAFLYTPGDLRLLEAGSTGFRWTLRGTSGEPLAVFDRSGSALRLQEEYVYLGGRLVASRSGGVTRHLHVDHQGTPRTITPTGQPPCRRTYAPYGAEISVSESCPSASLELSGHERDANGETLYMRGRTYDDSACRFLSPDPGSDGWNRYAYAGNSPLQYVDPTGAGRELDLVLTFFKSETRPVIVIGNDMNWVNATRSALNTAAGAAKFDVQFVAFGDVVPANLIDIGTKTNVWWPAQDALNSELASGRFGGAVVAQIKADMGEFLPTEFAALRAGGTSWVAAEAAGAEARLLSLTRLSAVAEPAGLFARLGGVARLGGETLTWAAVILTVGQGVWDFFHEGKPISEVLWDATVGPIMELQTLNPHFVAPNSQVPWNAMRGYVLPCCDACLRKCQPSNANSDQKQGPQSNNTY
jgi:RHS repeat-associated protein